MLLEHSHLVTQIPDFKICLQGQEMSFQCKSTPLHTEIKVCVTVCVKWKYRLGKMVTILGGILSQLCDSIISRGRVF